MPPPLELGLVRPAEELPAPDQLLELGGGGLSGVVSRRTREIGIRGALGANPRRILGAILFRPLMQVGLGVAVGSILVGLTAAGFLSGSISARQIGLTLLYGMIMLAVCGLACVVPTRRALRVAPTEAMRADM